MHFTGNLKKDGKFWMVEVPELDVTTQGKTKKDALRMIANAIEALVDNEDFKIKTEVTDQDSLLVSANDPAKLMAFSLKR